ncbi:UNVERIFIED_CONTAM: hypothetical protein PYX00_008148 [Menopon gallinae]|uniref:Ubiquitin thioesterase OTU n=1 Tax=Menopon gallinae TaxID=328185 RepID=A0AAW2HLN3_9NEOP
MECLVLKLKTKSGQFVLKELTKNHTVSDLKVQLSLQCQISQNDLRVLAGYPPKPINLSNNSLTLDSIGVNTGDTLIVEEKKDHVQNKENENPVPKPDDMSVQMYEEQINRRGILMRKVVPADNSCLFTSVGFTISGKVDSSCVPYMRQLIAEHVAQDTETYSEAILGKSTDEYCKWIMKPDSWGGAIELSILSGYYGIEMDVVDTINAIINRFGEDKNYSQRIFLIFDGVHYDPLYLELSDGGDIQTIFPVSDEAILQEAQLLAEEAKSSRQYTDVNKFSLKCLVCQVLMKGQAEAALHARTSGHTNFGEVNQS